MSSRAELPEAFFQVGQRWQLLDAAEAASRWGVPVCAVEAAIYEQGLAVTAPASWQAVAC